jgi:hypothetical protein
MMADRNYMIEKVVSQQGYLSLEVTENRKGSRETLSLTFRSLLSIAQFREALAVCQGHREAVEEDWPEENDEPPPRRRKGK